MPTRKARLRPAHALVLCLCAIPLAAAPAGAETLVWDRIDGATAPNDSGSALAAAPDGCVYVAGSTTFTDGSVSLLLRKYSPQGTVRWTRQYHHGDVESQTVGNGVAVAPDGSVYVAGETAAPTQAGNALLLKYSASGALLWAKTFDGGGRDVANAVATDGSGVYITGSTEIPPSGGYEVLLQRYGPSGDLAWTRTFSGFRDRSWNTGVAVAIGNQIVHVAGQMDNGRGPDLFLCTFQMNGNKSYLRTFDGSSSNTEIGSGVAVAADGAVYVSGASQAPSGSSRLLHKYRPNGSLIWSTTESAPGNWTLRGYGVALARDGSVFQTSNVVWPPDSKWYHAIDLRRYSPDGELLWSTTHDGLVDTEGTSVAVGADGGVYVVGAAEGGGLLLLKYQ